MTGHAETAREVNCSLLLLSKVASIPPSLGCPQKQQQEIHAGNGWSLELAGAYVAWRTGDLEETSSPPKSLRNGDGLDVLWDLFPVSLHVSECDLLMPHPTFLLWKRVSVPNITAGSEARGLHQPRDPAACLLLLPYPHHSCCLHPAVQGRQSRLRGLEGAELWGQLLGMVVSWFASRAEGRTHPLLLSSWHWGALTSSPSWINNQIIHREDTDIRIYI